MSFQVNGQELRRIAFNNNYVNEVWYKDGSDDAVLVWENPIKIETETWEGLKILCDEVKNGLPWPEDIKVGSIRKLNLMTTVLGVNCVYVRLIGIDVEGPGTLTFQVIANGKNGVDGDTDRYHIRPHIAAGISVSCVWIGSELREKCQEFYNACEAKPYIKKVQKYTCAENYVIDTPANIVPELNEETVWMLSSYEIGRDVGPARDGDIKECSLISEGVYSEPYPYCQTDEYWELYIYPDGSNGDYYSFGTDFWLRNLDGGYGSENISGDPYWGISAASTGCRFVPNKGPYIDWLGGTSEIDFEPCFVIG